MAKPRNIALSVYVYHKGTVQHCAVAYLKYMYYLHKIRQFICWPDNSEDVSVNEFIVVLNFNGGGFEVQHSDFEVSYCLYKH